MSSCDHVEKNILCKEKQLVERLIPFNNVTSTWKEYVEDHSKDTRLAVVVSKVFDKNYKQTAGLFGWDAILGEEVFFNFPFWWAFDEIERGSLLSHSVERLKQNGLINHFDGLYAVQYRKGMEAEALSEMARYETEESSNNGISQVTVDDAVLLESFCLFLYCVPVAVLSFVVEMLVSWKVFPMQCATSRIRESGW